MIKNIEELSLNAWPSLQSLLYDGWIIRFADGYTKRSNSVNPLYSSSIDIDKKIHFCEYLYKKKNLPIVFKMTHSVYPGNLDEKLHANGYQMDSPTSVQTIDLNTVSLQVDSKVNFQDNLSNEWIENFCRMAAVPKTYENILWKILVNIVPDHCFVSLKSDDKIVACGLGILQSDYVGLFEIVTDKNFRMRGYGQQIVRNILDWGKQYKAKKGYLQVMLNNVPALHLYSGIGFVEQYKYLGRMLYRRCWLA